MLECFRHKQSKILTNHTVISYEQGVKSSSSMLRQNVDEQIDTVFVMQLRQWETISAVQMEHTGRLRKPQRGPATYVAKVVSTVLWPARAKQR